MGVSQFKDAKFGYAVAKNSKIISVRIQQMQAERKNPPIGWLEYDKKRIALAEELCEKDEQGKPRIIMNNYSIVGNNRLKFDAKVTELQTMYQDEIVERDANERAWEDFLNAEAEPLSLHMIHPEDLPKEISGSQTLAIFDMIIEKHGAIKNDLGEVVELFPDKGR
jgi:hypothetical protein